ncbi:MAG: response regulator [Gammaproteobacteria bacterium]|nr:response regulator [Gammaproteobacteria bacterium]
MAKGPANIDLVLCDIQMPVMDGNEATRRIRSLAPQLPVIGLTAHAFNQARQEAMSAGMVDYITKPYMLDTLVQAVLKHVSRPPESPMKVVPPSSPSVAPALATPEADWFSMQQHFAPQPGVLSALMSVASQTLPGVADQLNQALQSADLVRLAKVAHEIKGIALNLRTPGLTDLATQTQDQARQANPESSALGQRLSVHLQGFLTHLAALDRQASSMPGKQAQ